MQQVITAKQAKQITGGRTPLVPVEYEAAVKALQACTTLDEARYWDNKADALAAWAKIYHNDQVTREAKILKLHAYRRMGLLAAELQPSKALGYGRGHAPGPLKLLRQYGFSHTKAAAMRALARAPEATYEKIVKNPRSPAKAVRALSENAEWRELKAHILLSKSYMLAISPAELISKIPSDESRSMFKASMVSMAEWIDEVLQRLPK